jgi:hypothetical protein
MTVPNPLVPTDTNLSGLDGFMLNVERLMTSELVAVSTPEECWAALRLWCHAWKQVPAGSLPNDDKVLASFSGAGKRWDKVKKNALHGFALCSDGRLYHRFLCAEVMRASGKKKAYQDRRERDAKRLREWREKHGRNDDETRGETRFVAEETGTGQGHKEVSKKEEYKPASTEPVAAGGRAFSGKAIQLGPEQITECQKIYPFDDIEDRLRIYDAKFTEQGALGPLHRVLSFLATDADRRRKGSLSGIEAPAEVREEVTRRAHEIVFQKTGKWFSHWGPQPAGNGAAA